VTAVCVKPQPDGTFKAVEMPAEIVNRLREAASA
jgi:hypothetical protein